MNKTFAIACVATVAVAINTKLADMIANQSLTVGAPSNKKLFLSQNLSAVQDLTSER